MSGTKNDSGKPRVSLLSSIALIELSKVMTYGETKYASHNWRKGFKWSRIMDAAMRHLLAYNSGERIDKETNLSHLSHCMANLMMLVVFENTNVGEDDLFKGNNKPEEVKSEKTATFWIPKGMNLVDAVNSGEAMCLSTDYINGKESNDE